MRQQNKALSYSINFSLHQCQDPHVHDYYMKSSTVLQMLLHNFKGYIFDFGTQNHPFCSLCPSQWRGEPQLSCLYLVVQQENSAFKSFVLVALILHFEDNPTHLAFAVNPLLQYCCQNSLPSQKANWSF